MSDLTKEEKNKIAEHRKPDSELPTYFNASLNKEVPISRDFESFLILASDDVKQQAVNWINNSVKLSKQNSDRDNLIIKTLGNDAADATAKIDIINSELGDFNTFRENFINNQFSEVTEVGQILADMQKSIGEMTLSQDRANHLIVLLSIIKARLDVNRNDEKYQQELKSWSNSLTSY